MSLIDLIDNGMSRDPDRLCITDGKQTYSHRDAQGLSHKVAIGLRAAGLTKGARVAIFSPNISHALVCLIGILRAAAVWLPVQMRNSTSENIDFLAENGCSFIFFHSSVYDDVREIRNAVDGIKGMVCLDGQVEDAPSFDDWTSSYDGVFPDEAHDSEDLAWIKCTGGTTGRPKSVMICQRNVEALFASFHLCMPLSGPHVNLAAAPITHGAGNIALSIIFAGGSVVLLERAEPMAILKAIETYSITTMFLPPTVIYNLLALPATLGRDYSSLQYLISAGAPISERKLSEAIDIFGPVMVQAWGQTEAPFICSYLGPRDYLDGHGKIDQQRLKSCGRASPLMRVEAMDDQGEILPPGKTGELVVRGNLVMKGYFNRPEETEAAGKFGWHHTGDVGFRDADGYFYIVDRKKDMIISGGFNIYPSEIEQVLWKHASVLDCAVIGVPDDKWGEAVKAVVELKQGCSATEAELQNFCRDVLGGMRTPKSVEIWPKLPRSEFGKVLKREIRERYWSGQERRV